MDIKEMLRSGMTADDLLADFMKQLDTATDEIKVEEEKARREAEKLKKAEIVAEAREAFIDALVDYLLEMGVINPNDLSDDFYNVFTELCEGMEKESDDLRKLVQETKELMKLAKQFIKNEEEPETIDEKPKSKKNDDDILAAFLKTLM